MKHLRSLSIGATLILTLALAGIAFAQDGTDAEPTPVDVEGVVVAVDEEAGTADILQADGTIVTVSIADGDYDHPITTLLAAYFGEDYIADWTAALETLETDDGVIVGIEETTDEDGNTIWTATLEDGSEVTVEDEEEASAISDALEATTVSLTAEDDGSGDLTLPDVGEQIEYYHSLGIGYGELVKIYAIAAESQEACEAEEEAAAGGEEEAAAGGEEETEEPCGVTVEELAELVLNGASMGYLFETFGKPSLLGVGHVRQALDFAPGSGTGTGGESGGGGVAVCHNGHTIVVDASAVPAHTGHGDAVGGCP